jgi:hypothetical protein
MAKFYRQGSKTLPGNEPVAKLAETILSEPVFINNMELQESELYMKHLHQP